MKIFHPEDRAGGNHGRLEKGSSSSSRRSKRLRRDSALECLETRCLLSVYAPHAASPLSPEPVSGIALDSSTVFATFDSFDSIGSLSATVAINGGSAIAGNITAIGTEFVPAIGTIPEFTVTLPANSYTPTQAGAGTLQFAVTIADSSDSTEAMVSGSSDVQPAPLTLGAPPSFPSVSAGSPVIGVPVGTFSDPDPNLTAANFGGTIDWGDGSPDSPATIVSTGPGQYEVEGSHTYTQPQTTNISFQVANLSGGSAITGGINSVVVGDPPLDTATPIPVTGMQGQLLNNVPLMTFVSHNPLALPGFFTANIDWGDGNTSLGTIKKVGSSLTSSTFLVSGSNTYQSQSSSPFTITMNVSDIFGTTLATQTTSASIIQSPVSVSVLSVNGNAGGAATSSIANMVASVDDSNGATPLMDYIATIDWGDGSPQTIVPGSTFVAGSGGTFLVPSPGHTYNAPGLFPITVGVVLGNERIGVGTGFAHINAVPVGVNPSPVPGVTATAGAPISTSMPVAAFTIGSGSVSANGLTAVIDWGDGSPNSLGTIVAAGTTASTSTFNVTGNHTYTRAGAYNITVNFADANHTTATATNAATVAGATLGGGTGVPVVSGVSSVVNVPVATFIDPNNSARVGDIAASISWGDGSTSRGVVTTVGSASGGVLFQVSGSHAYAATTSQGTTLPMSVNVVDVSNLADVLSIPTSASIAQSTLTVSVLPVTAFANNGSSIPSGSIIATFTDSRGAQPTSVYSATIIWGDGAETDGASIVPLGGGSYAVTGGHTYGFSGNYVIKVAVHETDPTTQNTTTGFGGNTAAVAPQVASSAAIHAQRISARHVQKAAVRRARHHRE